MHTLTNNLSPIWLLEYKLSGDNRIQRFTSRAKTVEIAKQRLAERLASGGYEFAFWVVKVRKLKKFIRGKKR